MPTYQTLRVPLPSPVVPGSSVGPWRVILMLDERRFEQVLAHIEERDLVAELVRLRTHGVPYTLTIQSRSGVRMAVTTAQTSRRPGSVACLTVELTQAGIPLAHTAAVTAEVRSPGGGVTTLSLGEVADGRFATDIATPTAGVYRILARAKGVTLRGVPFTREGLRTLSVWTRGDDRGTRPREPGDQAGLDLCGFLSCVIDNGGIKQAAKRAGVDLNTIRKCLDRHCSH